MERVEKSKNESIEYELKKARQFQLRYEMAQEIGHVGNWEYDLQSGNFWGSAEGKRIYGFDPEATDFTSDEVYRCVLDADRDRVQHAMVELIENGKEYNIEFQIIPRNGTKAKTLWSVAEVKKNETGTPVIVAGVLQDITERTEIEVSRRESEEALRESRQRLEFALEAGALGIWDWNPRTGSVVYSDRWAHILEYSPDEIMPTAEFFKQHIHPEDRPSVMDRLTGHVEGHTPVYESEHRMRTRSGGWIWVLDRGKVSERDKDNIPVRVTGIITDITERKVTERKLQESEEKYKAAFMTSPDAVNINRMDGFYVDINSGFTDLTGYTREDVIGKLSSDINIWSIAKDREKLIEGLQKNGKVENLESVFRCKDGSLKTALMSARVINLNDQPHILSLTRDITEKKQLTDVLQRAQKLESLGVLAGGIAHDFNNLMSGVFGYIDIAKEEPDKITSSQYLSKAMNAIDRAKSLTGQLLTFAKGGDPIMKAEKLFPFVQKTAEFALSGANILCDFQVAPDLWVCKFDRNQIGQVIDNLIINAQQAMPTGGTIQLHARNITIEDNEHPILKKNNYVKISIIDSGIGIQKDHVSKIFDPFYSTKTKGHGLGLATCYSIITRHGGCIDVESEPGKGTSFHVCLPATQESLLTKPSKPVRMHKGCGLFLVMDDEKLLQDLTEKMLRAFGYSVVCREDGKDAIDLFASDIKGKQEIVGMIFDLTIPGGMGGKDAVAEIRKLKSDVPVFVASGYAEDPIMKNPSEYGFSASICKPFRKAELSEMLNKHMHFK